MKSQSRQTSRMNERRTAAKCRRPAGNALGLALAALQLICGGAEAKDKAEAPLWKAVTARDPPPNSPSRPALVIRRMAASLDGIVNGVPEANAELQRGAREIGRQLAILDAKSWQSERDRLALVWFTLSGGDPSVLARAIVERAVPEGEASLAKAAVAFARGDLDTARLLLDDVEPLALDRSVAAVTALVKALVNIQANADVAEKNLKTARLLSPGTHIEEAALRLSMMLAISSGRRDELEAALRRYALRFPRSLYAAEAMMRPARVLGALDVANSERGKQLLGTGLAHLHPTFRLSYILEIGEAALRSGKLETAELALKMARAAGPNEQLIVRSGRARVLHSAALVARGKQSQAMALMADIDEPQLSPALRELATTVRATAEFIASPPDGSQIEHLSSRSEERPSTASREKKTDPSQLEFERTTGGTSEALKEAERLLEGSRP